MSTTTTPAANPNTLEADINQALGVASTVAAVAAGTGNPIATGIAALLNTASNVASTVEANSAHATAVADIGTGVTALANSPLVQSNPTAAGLTSLAASFMTWLRSEFSKL
jgi:hypothetical protein